MWSNVYKFFLLHVKVTCLLMIKNNSNNSTEVCQTSLTAVHQQLKVDFVVKKMGKVGLKMANVYVTSHIKMYTATLFG